MAVSTRVRMIPNAGRRGGRRNRARRSLSDKQIAIFGTAAQKAALKSRRSRKRTNAVAKKARKRVHRAASRPRAVKNAGEIVGYTLVTNSGRRKKSRRKTAKKERTNMATPKRKRARRRSAASGHSKTTRRRRTTRRRHNTGAIKHHRRRSSSRRNPGMGGGLGTLVTTSAFALAGAAASKILPQMLLGANNTGWVGYAANAAAGFALWLAAEKVLHNRNAATGIAIGTAVMIMDRMINDLTPFGTYLSGAGFGDYQAQAFVTPQVLTDPYNSATIRIPAGWGTGAPPPMPASSPSKAAAAVGVGQYGAANLYGGQSVLY